MPINSTIKNKIIAAFDPLELATHSNGLKACSIIVKFELSS